MPKEDLVGWCDSCEELVEGELEWNDIDGFIALVGSSRLIEIMLAHHTQFKGHYHNKFVLFKNRDDVKLTKDSEFSKHDFIKDIGFIVVSSASHPIGDIF
jgi:hypothetical protein